MKKSLSLILTILMMASLLSGCVGTTVVIGECTCPPESHTGVTEMPTEPAVTEPADTEPTATEPAGEAVRAVKTGLALITDIGDTVSASEEAEGAAAFEVTLAAVTVDDNGVIRACVLDSVSGSAAIKTDGTFSNDVNAPICTKNEMGADYGMVAFGGAIAEWDQQAAALAQFAVGKTVEELRNGAVDETGRAPDGSDLQSSATIYLGGLVGAIEAAVANARHLGAREGDSLELVSTSTLDSSTPADSENAGNAQFDCTVAVVTHTDGVITSCYLDALQAKIAFDAAGTITTDLSVPMQTKNQLGENYGMVAWGGAIGEWDQQAAAFCAYVTGKTPAEVAGIAVTETTKPADGSDLASSVTIAIGGFQGLIAKAFAQ